MIILAGDTHGAYEIDKICNDEFLNSYPFSRDDKLIVLGDFGIFESDEPNDSEFELLKIIDSLPFTLLFIDGNHENFNRLYKFPIKEKFGGKVSKCSNNCFWLRRGEIYSIDGYNILTFGGAMSMDKEDRELNVSWWEAEIPSDKEMQYCLRNLENFLDKGAEIDIVLTHTAPKFIVKMLGFNDELDPVPFFLNKIFDIAKPKEWFFGHFHKDINLKEKGSKFNCLYNQIIGFNPKK
ncbi:MAG: hypothetical protein GXZ15_00400 [Campylobacter sp.]|nr:hypothetical protein [Campylobacter sp.]